MNTSINLIEAIGMAVLQGMTELFPVSSLGHAVILPHLLRWDLDQNSPAYFETLQSEDDVLTGLDKGQADVMIGFVSSVDPLKYAQIPLPEKYGVDSVYYVFIPKSSKNAKDAEDMVKLLTSAQGKTILKSYRYLPAPK